MFSFFQAQQRTTTSTWNSAECAKTAGSCCVATAVRARITRTVSTHLCPRFPTATGNVPDVLAHRLEGEVRFSFTRFFIHQTQLSLLMSGKFTSSP